MLTQERLKELLDYDKNTGLFTWKIYKGRVTKGYIAGTICRGYINIKIDNKLYKAHRLAWLYMYGKLPDMVIDHIDSDKTNNKISNLRDVSIAYNNQNIITCSKYKKLNLPVGVSICNRKKAYVASIHIDGKNKNLGRFHTVQEAHTAYIEAKREYHPGSLL